MDEVGLVRTVRAGVLRGDIHRNFMSRLLRGGREFETIVIVSPWISSFRDRPYSLESLVKHINRFNIPTYVFMRPPETLEQVESVALLNRCSSVELIYNMNLHAKIYACLGPDRYEFAILSSANMTMHSATLYEIGLIVLGVGGGDQVIKNLAGFGLNYLRTRPESVVAKKRGAAGHVF